MGLEDFEPVRPEPFHAVHDPGYVDGLFAHAGWSEGGGSCTFNGLMLAAKVLLEQGLADKVGILDLDMH